MHEQKGFVIAAAIAAFSLAMPASAQKDAAEKAQEGGIEHWIEYYKAEQRKSVAPSSRDPSVLSEERESPATPPVSGTRAGKDTERK